MATTKSTATTSSPTPNRRKSNTPTRHAGQWTDTMPQSITLGTSLYRWAETIGVTTQAHDLNSDGFGDSSYHVIENYNDHYPIIQVTNVIQPSIRESVTFRNASNTNRHPSPTENPPSGSTNNLPTSEESNETNLTTSVQQVLWVLVILTIVVVLATLVAYHLYKKGKISSKITNVAHAYF